MGQEMPKDVVSSLRYCRCFGLLSYGPTFRVPGTPEKKPEFREPGAAQRQDACTDCSPKSFWGLWFRHRVKLMVPKP